MTQIAAAQELLVQGAVAVAVAGLLCIVLGAMFDLISAGFGTRLRRLGAQAIGVCLFVLVAHLALIAVFGPSAPLASLIVIYAIVGLMLLQGALNLLFGPSVGSRVIATLLSSLVYGAIVMIARPFSALRDLFRKT